MPTRSPRQSAGDPDQPAERSDELCAPGVTCARPRAAVHQRPSESRPQHVHRSWKTRTSASGRDAGTGIWSLDELEGVFVDRARFFPFSRPKPPHRLCRHVVNLPHGRRMRRVRDETVPVRGGLLVHGWSRCRARSAGRARIQVRANGLHGVAALRRSSFTIEPERDDHRFAHTRPNVLFPPAPRLPSGHVRPSATTKRGNCPNADRNEEKCFPIYEHRQGRPRTYD